MTDPQPTSWITLPAEPTEAMVEAGMSELADFGRDDDDTYESGSVAIYRAMVAARPPAPDHAVDEHRWWLARQLLDDRLADDEAYGIIRYSPAIKAAGPDHAELIAAARGVIAWWGPDSPRQPEPVRRLRHALPDSGET